MRTFECVWVVCYVGFGTTRTTFSLYFFFLFGRGVLPPGPIAPYILYIQLHIGIDLYLVVCVGRDCTRCIVVAWVTCRVKAPCFGAHNGDAEGTSLLLSTSLWFCSLCQAQGEDICPFRTRQRRRVAPFPLMTVSLGIL